MDNATLHCTYCGFPFSGNCCPECGAVVKNEEHLVSDGYDPVYHNVNYTNAYGVLMTRTSTGNYSKTRRISRDEIANMLRTLGTHGLLHAGKEGDVLICAVVFIIIRMRSNSNSSITIADSARLLNVTPSSVLSRVNTIIKTLNLVVSVSTDPYYYIERVITTAEEKVSDEAHLMIEKIIDILFENDGQAGRKPLPTIGGVVSMVFTCYGIGFNSKKIAAVCRASPTTLEQRIKEISLSLLTIAKRIPGSEIITIDNISLHLRYVINTCVPLVKMITICPIAEHPNEIKRKMHVQKRRKQVEQAKEYIENKNTYLCDGELKRIIQLLMCGVSENIIYACQNEKQLRRELEITQQLNNRNSSDDDDSSISTHYSISQEVA
ncbi:Transcription initiation factor IIB [Entamoeba marina]